MSYWREVVEGSDYHLKSQEWEDLLSELEELQAGAASRDAEVAELKSVPMKYRRMAFNAQLQDEVVKLEKENNQLRAQINVLREALSAEELRAMKEQP